MAVKKTKTIQPAEFVTTELFSQFQKSIEGALMTMVDEIKKVKEAPIPVAPPVVESPLERDIRKAAPDEEPVNPAWREKAEEILGEALDHCEVHYPKKGGTLFTVVIKREHSNAPANYLEFFNEDRRTKDVSAEGFDGVEQWCKLVKANLDRKQPHLN